MLGFIGFEGLGVLGFRAGFRTKQLVAAEIPHSPL